jgi:hypothetical protein
LAELLELRVVAKKVQVSQARRPRAGVLTKTGKRVGRCSAASSLGSGFKEVNRLIASGIFFGLRGSWGS